jgi:DDE_Tnp_1-associated/Transposase DDE domain
MKEKRSQAGERKQRRQRRKQERQERRRVVRELRQRRAAQGLKSKPRSTIGNATQEWKTVEEERQARQQAIEEQIKVYRAALPTLWHRLQKIPDPRNAKTIRHKSTVLMLYGMLVFVFQMGSRREANRQMTLPQFHENLRLLFPELESLPHQDTLNRLLASIEVEQLEATLVELIQHFIRKKKFYRYLVSNCYPIAIDGTEKMVRGWLWSEQCLERHVHSQQPHGSANRPTQYYVYVLEANLAFANGMTIPLLSEFLSDAEGDQGNEKQDCELKAFYRLAKRLHTYFPRLPILVLLDGLYAKGPVLQWCRDYGWQFMIVLKDECLPSVWEEFRGLGPLQPNQHLEQNWGNRKQHFHWVNGIEYRYGEHERKRQILHVVVCQETWEEIDLDSVKPVRKSSRHAWISSEELSRENVHERSNLGARHRWAIESNLLVEKHHGYQYEHCFSHNWNAMKGYHFLMRLGHLLNTLAQHTARLAHLVRSRGVRGLIQFLRETCSGPWLNAEQIRRLLAAPGQLRLE